MEFHREPQTEGKRSFPAVREACPKGSPVQSRAPAGPAPLATKRCNVENLALSVFNSKVGGIRKSVKLKGVSPCGSDLALSVFNLLIDYYGNI